MPIDQLLHKYDLYYTNPGGAQMGFMLALDQQNRKLWRRTAERGLPDSFAPGDIGYANLSPDIQKVIAHRFMNGGLGALEFEVEDDADFQILRYLKSQDIDLRCRGKVYPGPKVSTLKYKGWTSPTGHDDYDTDWADETLAYNNNTTDYAKGENIGIKDWTTFLGFTIGATNVTKIRYWVGHSGNFNRLDLDAYYDSAWHHVFEGTPTWNAWQEKELPSSHSVTEIRMRFYNPAVAVNWAYIYEVELYSTDDGANIGAVGAFAKFNGKLYGTSSDYLIRLNEDGNGFEKVRQVSSGKTITHLDVLPDNLFIALAAANKYWYMDTDETFTESTLANGEADRFCKVGTDLWQLKLPNKVRKATGGDPTNAGGWDAEILIDEAAYNVNDMWAYLGLLYCLKENGVFYVDGSGVVHEPFPELRSISHADSGKNSVVVFNKLYFRMGNQKEREIDSTTITDITPSLFSPGISDYAHPCVARAQDDDWLYALMYRGANDLALLTGRWEYVAGITRWIWHDIRKITGITNASCAIVSSIEGRPYLYIGSTTASENVLKVYLPVTNDATADSGYKFATAGSLWTPRYTTLLLAISKRWQELFARTENLGGGPPATKYINAYYSTDDGGSFALLKKFDTSPEQTEAFTNIEATMINLRLDFVSDSETTVPVLKYLNLKALTLMPSVTKFNHAVKCANKLRLKVNIVSNTSQAAIMTFLDTLRDEVCTLGDRWGSEHTVRVRVVDERESFDEDTQQPETIVEIEAVKVT